jgi:hypothetical protein
MEVCVDCEKLAKGAVVITQARAITGRADKEVTGYTWPRTHAFIYHITIVFSVLFLLLSRLVADSKPGIRMVLLSFPVLNLS